MSDCKNYLLLSIVEDCKPVNRLYYFDMRDLGDEGITGRWAVLHLVPSGQRWQVHSLRLVVGLIPFVKLIDNFDAEYDYVTNEGTVFTFKTNLNAPKYKLINIDLSKPEPADWMTLVDEHESDVLEVVCCVNGDKLILIYMHDVKVTVVPIYLPNYLS